ncbi:MAG TPA: VOC family protein [Caulobacteraceae bacterium]|jgi:catechol 2,3-dioxygenase-like lactoylglutathione lyase family enzyme
MRSPDFLTAVGIGVADLDRSTAFYRDVLGMKVMQTFKVEYMDEVMLAHEGRNAVVLMHYTDGSERNYANNPVKLVFYVVDPAPIVAKVKSAGLEVTREPAPIESLGGAVVCLAKDPDGYTIELIQRAPAVTPEEEVVPG